MKSDLPNASQFSPTQTPLPDLLKILKQYEPDRKAVEAAIQQTFFPERAEMTEWAWKLANNTVIAMSQYGLVDKPKDKIEHVALTDLGNSLYAKAAENKFAELYDEFVRHILLNLHGLDVVSVIDDLVASGKTPTKHLIVKELRHRGIYHPPNGTHANGMRQWFEQAGLVPKDQWTIDRDRLQAILGTGPGDIEAFAGLTKEQRDFAKAFARLNTDRALSNKVADYATTLYGTEFPEGGLPQSVLFALEQAGLIKAEKTTKGQGAKPYVVRPTDKLKNEVIEPLLDAIEQSGGIQYRKLIRMKYEDILKGLKSKSTHDKGLALEALAFYLARLLDLQFVKWRLRSSKTGGAEVDVVMEGARLIFSRWQIQCKNSAQATLEDIAKEVGVAQVIKSNVILIVSTGKIGPAARAFAEEVMQKTSLYVALINGGDLEHLLENPSDVVEIINSQVDVALAIRKQPRSSSYQAYNMHRASSLVANYS
ncbi:MAG: restriction endonuclease [Anaerolineae bacterium]